MPHRYPSCAHAICMDAECCGNGGKYRWPELVGQTGEVAKTTIERESPNVTVIVLAYGDGRLADFCCNRFFVYLDANGNVESPPMMG